MRRSRPVLVANARESAARGPSRRRRALEPWLVAALALSLAPPAIGDELNGAGARELALTLEETIHLALRNNRTLLSARHRRETEKLTLDVASARIDRRVVQVECLRARARLEELQEWQNGVEASRARRAVTKARIALETDKNRLAESTFLLEQGLIPAANHQAAEREHRTRSLDLESAEQDLAAILARGAADEEVARLEFKNARARLDRIDEILRNSTLVAPVAGVVLLPGEGERSSDTALATGAPVNTGDHLLTVGDLSGLTAIGRVDEGDVVRIRPGQAVRTVGAAFPGVVLDGEITRVSSQASRANGNRVVPSFEVAAAVETLTDEQRSLIRLGMSTRIEVVIHDRPDALLVPVDAVNLSGGRPRVRIMDRDSAQVRDVEVTTGVTTVDAVEILSGLEAGDQVVVQGR